MNRVDATRLVNSSCNPRIDIVVVFNIFHNHSEVETKKEWSDDDDDDDDDDDYDSEWWMFEKLCGGESEN